MPLASRGTALPADVPVDVRERKRVQDPKVFDSESAFFKISAIWGSINAQSLLRAGVLVTGDGDLLEIADGAPLAIVNPRGFWDSLRS